MFRSLSVFLLTLCLIVLLSVFPPSPMNVRTKSKSANDPPSRPPKRVKVKTSEGIASSSSSSSPMLLSLKLVSMNVAEFIPSAVAPSTWDTLQSAQALCTELLQSDPDIIALQEVPDGHVELLLPQLLGGGGGTTTNGGGYTMVGSSPAHAGTVILLVRTILFQSVVRVPVVYDKGSSLPVVMAQLQIKDNSNCENGGPHHVMVVVASCHLAPFDSGSDQRRRQVEIILQAAAAAAVEAETTRTTDSTTRPAKGQRPCVVVLAGDTNMRDEEDDTMEHGEFHLLDAWKLAGSNPATKYSWDTVDHTTHGGGKYFNQYYGSRTRQYHRRYDRIYLSAQLELDEEEECKGHDQHFKNNNDNVNVNITVPNFQLIANQPLLGSTNHFLSDHFGISAQISVTLERATQRPHQHCNAD
jgi:endonuclease/exonuclease/phosphatase family metal-dependent hydrolase